MRCASGALQHLLHLLLHLAHCVCIQRGKVPSSTTPGANTRKAQGHSSERRGLCLLWVHAGSPLPSWQQAGREQQARHPWEPR